MSSLSAQVRSWFEEDSPLAKRLPGYELRPEQAELAQAIARKIEEGKPLVAEAGTGVGKSFAYLLPALLHATAEGKKVIVSTRTKALQEQLDRKDLPFLQAVLGREFTWTLCVGRNNYVCLRRLEKAGKDASQLFTDLEHWEQLRRIQEWAAEGRCEGRSSELPFVPDGRVWSEVQAEQGNCLGKDCRFYEPCYWQRGRRRMRTAQLLVVNHALYFADLSLRLRGAAFLPDHDLVIFDEAHHIEEIAGEALGLRFSPAMIEWQLSRLYSKNGRRGLLVRRELPELAPMVFELREVIQRYWISIADIFSSLGGDREGGSVRFFEPIPDLITPHMMRLVDALRQEASPLSMEAKLELESKADRLEELSQIARAFTADTGEGEVRWMERERKQLTLRMAPISVANALREGLFKRVPRSILLSATLGPAEGGFSWIRGRLGLEDAEALKLGSPFPYERNVVLDIEEGLPDPSKDRAGFETEASQRATELVLENGGRSLILCTSWRFLNRCREILEPRLAEAGIPLLVQGDQPLHQLIQRKQDMPESVLIGTDSLWEGIDIPGDAVTLVILTRFPFPVPTHPLTQARMEAIERQGLSSFAHYSVPRALLKFRQGFGRLVRSSKDRGKVVILDPRARRKSYGRRFIDALPHCRQDVDEEGH